MNIKNTKTKNSRGKSFGGELLKGQRKSARPLSTSQPVHLILKSEHKHLFSIRNTSLTYLISKQAEKFGIKIYSSALNFSHIHLVIKIKRREDYVRFIRALTSLMAQAVRRAYPELETVFTLRPFTRIVSWGRDYKNILEYMIKNWHEAFGIKPAGAHRLGVPRTEKAVRGKAAHMKLQTAGQDTSG